MIEIYYGESSMGTRNSWLYWREELETGFSSSMPQLPEGYEFAPQESLEVSSAVTGYGRDCAKYVRVQNQFNNSSSLYNLTFSTNVLGVDTEGALRRRYKLCILSSVVSPPDETKGHVTLRINPDADLGGRVPYGWIVIPQTSSVSDDPDDPVDFSGGYVVSGETIELSGSMLIDDTETPCRTSLLLPITAPPVITFHPAGGYFPSGGSTKRVLIGSPLGELPVPARTGYVFSGWFTERESGVEVTEDTLCTGAATYYAHWESASVLVTLDARGGKVKYGVVKVARGAAYGTLPTPSRALSEFDGWYTEPDGGGERVTSATIVTERGDHTLYAKWNVKTGDLMYYGDALIFDDAVIQV